MYSLDEDLLTFIQHAQCRVTNAISGYSVLQLQGETKILCVLMFRNLVGVSVVQCGNTRGQKYSTKVHSRISSAANTSIRSNSEFTQSAALGNSSITTKVAFSS